MYFLRFAHVRILVLLQPWHSYRPSDPPYMSKRPFWFLTAHCRILFPSNPCVLKEERLPQKRSRSIECLSVCVFGERGRMLIKFREAIPSSLRRCVWASPGKALWVVGNEGNALCWRHSRNRRISWLDMLIHFPGQILPVLRLMWDYVSCVSVTSFVSAGNPSGPC